MATTALEAIEEVLAAGGDSHAATFLEELNKRGYTVAPMWFFKDVNHRGALALAALIAFVALAAWVEKFD